MESLPQNQKDTFDAALENTDKFNEEEYRKMEPLLI